MLQAYHSIMCRYFCIGFIDFMLKGKSLLDHTNLFSPNEYEQNDEIILKYFEMKMIYFITFGKYRKFENSEILYIFGKTLVLPIICSKCDDKKNI